MESWHCTVGSSWSTPWGPWGWGIRTWRRPPRPRSRSAGRLSACGCSSHCGSRDRSSGCTRTRRGIPGTCPGPRQSTRSSSGTNSSQKYFSLFHCFLCHFCLSILISQWIYFLLLDVVKSQVFYPMSPGLLGGGGWRACQSHLAAAGRTNMAAVHCSLRPHSNWSQSLTLSLSLSLYSLVPDRAPMSRDHCTGEGE